jgi:hypothetical protein
MTDQPGLLRLALALAVLLTLPGCVVQRDYGRGPCMEYTEWFFCWQGSMNCRTDDKGCRSCECAGAGDLRH